ncbi:MAG TPA: TorF family putative porin [Ramlibacter sp.]|nr:TorF family putative porin [Ramlibacter sp.]
MKVKATVLLSTLVLSGAAFAQAKAPEPDFTLSYNVGAVTDYRYRGISQTAKKPALQGGVDFAHKSGAYVGAWASTIRWIKDSGPNLKGPLELDLYGGYKGAITDTFSYDVGGLYYWYVNNDLKNLTGENANTFELYGAVSAGPATLKYSHALTTLFGAPNSENSGYLDLSATFDLGNGLSVVPHVGAQKIKGFGTYRDYSLTLAKDFSGLVVSGAVVGTDWKDHFGFPYTLPGSGNKDLGKVGVVVGLKKTF